MSKPSIWETVHANLPKWYGADRIKDTFERMARLASEYYERQGFIILEVRGPYEATEEQRLCLCPPDADRYSVYLRMTREPRTVHVEIPDNIALEVQEKTGLVFAE